MPYDRPGPKFVAQMPVSPVGCFVLRPEQSLDFFSRETIQLFRAMRSATIRWRALNHRGSAVRSARHSAALKGMR